MKSSIAVASPCRAAAASVCAVFWMSACSPALDWREVRTEGDAWVALLPCKPQRLSRAVPLAARSVTMEQLGCAADGVTWGVSSADMGDAASVPAALAAIREARARNLAGRESGARPAEDPGAKRAPSGSGSAPGSAALRFEVDGHRPDGTAVREHSLVWASGTRVFHAAAVGGAPSAEALDAFFGGLAPAR